MATIPEASELEVFVNNLGTITIRQDEEEAMLVVHPDDVSILIGALERARRKALRLKAEEHDEVFVPELFSRWRAGSA